MATHRYANVGAASGVVHVNDEARMTNGQIPTSVIRHSGIRHSHPARLGGPAARRAFTLVEMLVAMAITLVMMAAVVTLFANVSESVRNRRATIEMSSQLRHVRNVLQQDLQGATCPGVTWQRPESNHGYIEIIEGQYREGNASNLLDADPSNNVNWPPTPVNPEIDHVTSILPSSNLPFPVADWVTDGAGLGDFDDILMLTTRNEHEPFVGKAPANVRNDRNALPFDVDEATDAWSYESIESPLAEVVWFAIENPGYTDDPADPSDGQSDPSANGFFGEPGMRTIYRRTLLIAPWLNPYRYVDPNTGESIDTFSYDGGDFKAEPGLLRILPSRVDRSRRDEAIAAVIAFQDRYDLSVRLEWDHYLDRGRGRWKIMANTLGDLTKRENRFGHFGFKFATGAAGSSRVYPYAMVSFGSGYSSTPDLKFVRDPEAAALPSFNAAKGEAHEDPSGSGTIVAYEVTINGQDYPTRPFVIVEDENSTTPATAQAMLNDDGAVVRVLHGPMPLWGTRRGEDVMMTGVLAFDLRVYDPGAPLFATRQIPGDATSDLDVVLDPSDPGWRGMPPDGAGGAYLHNDNMGSGEIGTSGATFPYVGQGAYVDLGYGYDARFTDPLLPIPDKNYHPNFASSAPAWFFEARGLSDVYLNSRPPAEQIWSQLAPGYAVYDTWSFHYENNGVNEDQFRFDGSAWQPVDDTADEGTDGLDGPGNYSDTWNEIRLGVDDIGERETAPPYDKPLRGVQVLIRTYETDSRAIRQVRVNQHFMPE